MLKKSVSNLKISLENHQNIRQKLTENNMHHKTPKEKLLALQTHIPVNNIPSESQLPHPQRYLVRSPHLQPTALQFTGPRNS